ncbi:MAG: calcium/sodium antiporter [Parahaliea sp.]
MLIFWLLLAVGLALLISGADLLVRGAARLAVDFGVPTLVIGLTVVAFGTSAPELAVSVKSAWSGQTELAIANVVGSNIFNILFILGLAAIIAPLAVSSQLIRRDVPLMILVSAAAGLMTSDGSIDRREAIVLFAGLVIYSLLLFIQGRKQGIKANNEEIDPLINSKAPNWQNLTLIITGLTLLVLGARLLVNNAVLIASSFGISEAIIGLTIVSIGTSLPEAVTSVVATFKGQRDIAIGNVVGSNIFNILCVLGISGIISPEALQAGVQLQSLDIPVMLAAAVLCLPLFITGASLNRLEGLVFLALYGVYLGYLITFTVAPAYLPTLQSITLYGVAPFTVIFVASTLIYDMRQKTISSR